MAKTPRSAPVRVQNKNSKSRPQLSRRAQLLIAAVLFAIVGATIVALSSASDPSAVPVGIIKSQYTYPSNAIFVAPNGNTGAAGNQAMPLRTLKEAIQKSPTGGTIVMRAGVYREELGTITKPVTIQPYPNEEVWLDGSDPLTGLVQDGKAWRKDGWTAGNTICPNSDCSDPNLVVTADNPLAGLPDMVFVNGVPIKQVATLAEVVEGTFFVDRAGQKLYVGTNPTGKTLEATTRREALFYYSPSTAGSKLRGIGVRRYAGNIEFSNRSKPGQINASSGARGLEFDQVVFTQGAGNGLFIAGANGNPATGVAIKNSLFASNGGSGLAATRLDGLVLENNIFFNNNNEKPNIDGVNGSYAGSKITYLTNSTVKHNLFQNNYGTGFWCDLACDNNMIVGNMARGNTLQGLYYEISTNAIIASNVSYGNGQYGIKVSGRNVKVYNNTAYNNVWDNFFLYDDDRLVSQNIQVKNNITASGPLTRSDVRLLFARPNMSNVGSVITALDRTLYFRTNTSNPRHILGWQGTNINASYTTLDATMRAQTGREANGTLIDGKAIGTLFKDAGSGNFQLITGSSAVSTGEALPADVAAAIGVPSNQAVNRGALSWKDGVRNAIVTSTPDPIVTPPAPVNQKPTASVEVSATSAVAPAGFQVKASAIDTDGTIAKLEILQNGSVVFSCYNVPTCVYVAANYGSGSFSYYVKAYDNAQPNGEGASATQTIVVRAPATPPTPPPTPVPALTAPSNIVFGVEQSFFSIGLGLRWNAVSGATGYKVTPVGKPSAIRPTANYLQPGVASGNVYSFEVSATNGTSESPKTSVKALVTCDFWIFGCRATPL